LTDKSLEKQEADIHQIYETLGPCDLSVPDIEYTIPDENIIRFVDMAERVMMGRG
jgi:hypothetical protein